MDEMAELHLDALESALGTKIKDREAFLSAFRGLVSCCGEEEDNEEPEGEEESSPGPKKGPSIALILGGKPKEK